MGSLAEPEYEVRIMLEGKKPGVIKMVTAMLAMFDTETIKIQSIKYYERIILVEDHRNENDEPKKILKNVIELLFEFIIFEEEEELSPYLENLRGKAESIVNNLTINGSRREATIINSDKYKQLELPMKK